MPVKNKDGRTHLISSEQAGDASENLSYRGQSGLFFRKSQRDCANALEQNLIYAVVPERNAESPLAYDG
jgi:hypothetical protein